MNNLLLLMKVWKSSSSMEALQTTLEDTVSQLEEQGLLTGEALGQIFTSVSDMLNSEANQDQMEARMEVNTMMFLRSPSFSCEAQSGTIMLLCLSAQGANVDQN